VRIGAIAAIFLVLLAQALPLGMSRPAQAATTRSNIVVVMVDDMPPGMVDDLPRLQSLLSEQGLSFSSFYVAAPQCCPSRASFLRAQYPRNTGVLINGPPQGGVSAFRNNGNESSTIATWLDDAGYRTALIGKYMNDYEKIPKHVPGGWDRWFVYAGKGKYRNFLISDEGKVRAYGKQKGKKKSKNKAKHYQTDVLTRKGIEFITSTPDTTPLFLFLSPPTPHEPATPAKRHQKSPVARSGAPRPPSFNEEDTSDKPGIWSNQGQLGRKRRKAIDRFYVKQLRSMFAVEDMIGDVVNALEAQGRLDNTYVLFTSDNGFHHGEHRIALTKNSPFEESIRAPLIVVGPGVPVGETTDAMASMVDLGPTFAGLAGIAPPDFVDGRSVTEIFQSGATPGGWRNAVISEQLKGPKGGFVVLRAGAHAYVAYGDGTRELYDLGEDPYQLDNVYQSIGDEDPGLIAALETQLDALAECGNGGPTACQEADRGS
jgi:arylsulfatase A-like enzyme